WCHRPGILVIGTDGGVFLGQDQLKANVTVQMRVCQMMYILRHTPFTRNKRCSQLCRSQPHREICDLLRQPAYHLDVFLTCGNIQCSALFHSSWLLSALCSVGIVI